MEYALVKRKKMPVEKAILSWSGGRESALALHEIQKSGKYEIPALLTTSSASSASTA